MHRRTAVVAGPLALAALLAVPADAAPRRLEGAYTTGPTVPDPTTGGVPHDTCEGLPSSRHRRALALPAAGVLRVTVTSTGDWGLVVRDARGRALARSDTQVSEPERATVRLRSRGRVLLEACNFAGAPTARVSWTYVR